MGIFFKRKPTRAMHQAAWDITRVTNSLYAMDEQSRMEWIETIMLTQYNNCTLVGRVRGFVWGLMRRRQDNKRKREINKWLEKKCAAKD